MVGLCDSSATRAQHISTGGGAGARPGQEDHGARFAGSDSALYSINYNIKCPDVNAKIITVQYSTASRIVPVSVSI